MLSRRGLLGTMLAAPAIVRTPGLLRPTKPIRDHALFQIDELDLFRRDPAAFMLRFTLKNSHTLPNWQRDALLELSNV